MLKKNLWLIALVMLAMTFTGLLANSQPSRLDVREALAATPTATATATATATPAWTETGS